MVEALLNRKIRKSNKNITFKKPKRSNTVRLKASKEIEVETTPTGGYDTFHDLCPEITPLCQTCYEPLTDQHNCEEALLGTV